MAGLPPAYQGSNYNDIPSYSETAAKPDQWRIVTSLNQKKRFMTVAPVSEAATGDPDASGPCSYRIGVNNSLQLQARGFRLNDPNGDCFEGPNGPSASSQSIVANIELLTGHASLGDITFVEPGRDQNIFVDAKDLSTSSVSNDILASQDLGAYLTYHEGSQKVPLPVSWRVEPRNVQQEEHLPNKPIVEEKKKSFWKLDKDSSKHKHHKSTPDPVLDSQKAMLNSTFRLCDDAGNVYATFESDFYAATQTPLPKGFKRVSATHRSWGTASIRDPGFKQLRSQVSVFEKWSDYKLEQFVLVSLVSCLEINLRLQGGSEGEAFAGAMKGSAVLGSIFGAEGLGGMANKLTGGMGQSYGGGLG